MPVLEAADGKAVRLIVRIAVNRGIAGIQVAVPGIGTGVRRRPEVGVRAAIVEIARVVPVAG